MGRIANERHVQFLYLPGFVDHYKQQPSELKQLCDDIGKPYGYSGMNVFFIFFIQYWSHDESGIERIPFAKTS